MRPLACLIAFLLLTAAAHAKPPRVNGVAWIGGLELHFDANRWEVNGADLSYNVFCEIADCANTAIAITIANTADACTPDLLTIPQGEPPAVPGSRRQVQPRRPDFSHHRRQLRLPQPRRRPGPRLHQPWRQDLHVRRARPALQHRVPGQRAGQRDPAGPGATMNRGGMAMRSSPGRQIGPASGTLPLPNATESAKRGASRRCLQRGPRTADRAR